MNKKDIVRNPLVTRIVDAYEKDNEMKKVNINVHEDPDETEPDADDKSD